MLNAIRLDFITRHSNYHFFVIGTHETHFIAARCLGVKVLRFAICFGKKLLRWHDRSGTEYIVALITLGGYVQMLDESEDVVPPNELHLAYNRQPFYKKFLIVSAGPFVNVACALLLYWLLFVIGVVTVKPIIGSIHANSIAAAAGMQGEQEIIQVDNVPTQTWTSVLFRVLAHAGNQDHVKLETKDMSSQKTHSYLLDLSNWHMNELIPNPFTSLGIIPYEPPIPLVIGLIAKKSPAVKSNLQVGDKIVAINRIPIKNWDELITFVISHPDQTALFTLEQHGKTRTTPVAIGVKRNIFLQKTGYLGISPTFTMPPELLHTMQFGPYAAMEHAWKEITDFTYFNFVILGKLFTGKLSLQSLGGPIAIFQTAGEALNRGMVVFVGFLAFISLSIGLVNLLPIPGLDGGHLFMQIIESLIRRPIPLAIQLLLYRLGFIFIILILIQTVMNDLLRMY